MRSYPKRTKLLFVLEASRFGDSNLFIDSYLSPAPTKTGNNTQRPRKILLQVGNGSFQDLRGSCRRPLRSRPAPVLHAAAGPGEASQTAEEGTCRRAPGRAPRQAAVRASSGARAPDPCGLGRPRRPAERGPGRPATAQGPTAPAGGRAERAPGDLIRQWTRSPGPSRGSAAPRARLPSPQPRTHRCHRPAAVGSQSPRGGSVSTRVTARQRTQRHNH